MGPSVQAPNEPTPSSPLDPSIVVRLHAEHAAELRRFVLGVVRDTALADDVVQATFAKLVQVGGSARDETLKGWLFRVAYHEALTARRRNESRDRAHRRISTWINAASQCPEDPILRAESIEAVRTALERLSDEQRRVVRARIEGDKTFAQIAAEFGIPLGTVLTRMRRALQTLRNVLTTDEPES